MSKPMNDAINLKTAVNLQDYLEKKAETHNFYKLYSTEERIENNIHERALFLSDGTTWNDCVDREKLNCIKGQKSFALCFSFSASESVAMWMLYGGMKKRGAMINFNQKMIIEAFKKNQSIELGFFENGHFVLVQKLFKGSYKLRLTDVLYYGESKKNKGAYRVRRSDEYDDSFDLNKFIVLPQCLKKYSWSYENECRLIVSIDKQLIHNDNINTVKFPLPLAISSQDIEKRVILSPNYNGYKNWKKSELTTEMDWDLCKGCKPCKKQELYAICEDNIL